MITKSMCLRLLYGGMRVVSAFRFFLRTFHPYCLVHAAIVA